MIRDAESGERWSAIDSRLKTHDESLGRVVPASNPNLPHNDARNTRNGRFSYSVLATLRHISAPHKYKLDGIQLETHQEMDKQRRENQLQACQGVMIPLDLQIDERAAQRFAQRAGVRRQVSYRALDTNAGAGAIPTILEMTMIELLRARMVTPALGARILTDMQGLFAIPRQTGASTFYMVTQGNSVTPTNQTIDQVPFSPHTGGAMTQYTRQFLEQTNQDAEMFTREDLTQVVARGVETQGLNGTGSNGYPLGILQDSQIGIIPLGTNGAAPTWPAIVNLESAVAAFNADMGSLAYVMDAATRGTLKTTLKIGSTYPIYLWNTEAPDFPVNGYPVGVTNLMPSNLSKGTTTGTLHAMIYGNWEDLIYAFWSGLDVILDPYTAAPQGAVNIIALQDFDVNKRHYQSFANIVDLVVNQTIPPT